MTILALQLPESANRFIKQRQLQGDVSAVLLYGSYARGTHHVNSDIDIIFVVDQGFKRECVVQDGLLFEVLEETKNNMYSFWERNMDVDRHWYLWKDMKILFDRDGEGKEIIEHAMSFVSDRHPWPSKEVQMRKLIMLHKINNIRHVSSSDSRTAALLLVEFVWALIENWFGIRGRFIPSSKEVFTILPEEDPVLSDLLGDFYTNPVDLDTKFKLAERIYKAIHE